MTEEREQADVPHDDELDVEAPNEGATGDQPEESEDGEQQQ
jgi:hypothetical protein